ncbi:MAG: hypothetical protein O9345_15935 [Burkholderiaceae bacterium]|nr:hypothetical protein [Burkholderiales bacterium]MCZ8339615.1 hypothetical protein [Burkholderiaceae bacterium]
MELISVQLYHGGTYPLDASTGRPLQIRYAVVARPDPRFPTTPWMNCLHCGQQYGEGAAWHWTVGGAPAPELMVEINDRLGVLAAKTPYCYPCMLQEDVDPTDAWYAHIGMEPPKEPADPAAGG